MSETEAIETESPEKPGTALALLGDRMITATDVYLKPQGVRAILDGIKAEVAKIPIDISTPKGRGAAKSLAFKVARSKTTLLDLGLGLTKGLRDQVDAVNADRKVIETELDGLKAEVLADLTAWEAAEDARVKGHEDALFQLLNFSHPAVAKQAPDEIEGLIERAQGFAKSRDWHLDFRKRASDTLATVVDTLGGYLVNARHRVAEEELARQRKEEAAEAERERLRIAQAEREERIAAAAKEQAEKLAAAQAAFARVEAERLHRLERERAEKAEQDRVEAQALQRLAEEKAEAERVRTIGDLIIQILYYGETPDTSTPDRIKSQADYAQQIFNEINWQEFRERAADALSSTTKKLDAALVVAESRREAERIRVEREVRARAQKELDEKIAAENAAAAKRAENVAHRRTINRSAVAKLVTILEDQDGTSYEEKARVIVEAIAKGAVPHIQILY